VVHVCDGRGFEEELLGAYAFYVLRALTHLHDAGITHRNISSSNVLLDPQVTHARTHATVTASLNVLLTCAVVQGGVKLADYGLYFCTRPSKKFGPNVSFPIGYPLELLLSLLPLLPSPS
jgi:serine/threonine protein kinase